MSDKSDIYPTSGSADMARERAYHSRDDSETCFNESPSDHSEPATPSSLLNTIESEILPRLMLVHSSGSGAQLKKRPSSARIEPETIDSFVDKILDHSTTSGNEMVAAMVRDGTAIETVYLDLLAPAARQMGELWESDVRSFTDVTIGLCRLHEVLRHNSLHPQFNHVSPAPETPSVLLSTACGDQHVFGIIMVAEFFRKEGWQVTCEPGAASDDLSRIVQMHNYDVIGLSVACSVDALTLSKEIQDLRNASLNKDIKIILGGALIQRDIGIANKVNADGAMTDASHAPAAAMNLLAHTRVGC